MKKMNVLMLSSGFVLIVLAIIIGSIWISAYNGAVTKSNEIKLRQTEIYSAYSNRYEKVVQYIDAIDSADATILNQLTLIMDARTAFANAMSNNDLDVAENASSTIESTFIDLISYMEDNPSNWTTIGLTSNFMSEFSASTNNVTNRINAYNASITEFNTFITLFPNNLFTGGYTQNTEFYVAPNFNTELPTMS